MGYKNCYQQVAGDSKSTKTKLKLNVFFPLLGHSFPKLGVCLFWILNLSLIFQSNENEVIKKKSAIRFYEQERKDKLILSHNAPRLESPKVCAFLTTKCPTIHNLKFTSD